MKEGPSSGLILAEQKVSSVAQHPMDLVLCLLCVNYQ